MLDQPDPFGRVAPRDRLGARLHLVKRVGVLRQSRGDDPFDRRRMGGAKQGHAGAEARIEHAAL